MLSFTMHVPDNKIASQGIVQSLVLSTTIVSPGTKSLLGISLIPSDLITFKKVESDACTVLLKLSCA